LSLLEVVSDMLVGHMPHARHDGLMLTPASADLQHADCDMADERLHRLPSG
jgi:hypothetical protein